MLCPSCGRDVGEEIGLCYECSERQSVFGADTLGTISLDKSAVEASLEEEEGAGFWLRTIAAIIDAAVLFAIFEILLALGFGYLRSRSEDANQPLVIRSAEEISELAMGLGTAVFGTTVIVFLLLSFFYYVLFEVLPSQGTVGKSLLGIVVVRGFAGESPGVLRAIVRNFSKIFSLLMFGFGFLMVALTSRKQALHDLLSGCRVVKRREVGFWRIILSLLTAIAFPIILGAAFAVAIRMETGGSLGSGKVVRSVPPPSAPSRFSGKPSSGVNPDKTSRERPRTLGVSGVLQGERFVPNRAEFSSSSNTLAFRYGRGVMPEQEVLLFLFMNENLKEGVRIVVNSSSSMLVPHVHIKWRARGSGAPQSMIYSSKSQYTLDLLFEEIGRGFVRGKIVLDIRDRPQTKVSGTFVAALK